MWGKYAAKKKCNSNWNLGEGEVTMEQKQINKTGVTDFALWNVCVSSYQG
jgi:hypothetical protein